MATPPTTRRRRRWPWVVLATLLLAATAVAAWMRTESALATAVRLAERVSDGRLRLDGVAGSLTGPLSVQRLEYRDGGVAVSAEAVEMDWSPLALLAATVRVDRLAARALTVNAGAGSNAAPTAPASLKVPIRVELRDLRIERVAVDGAGGPLVFSPVAGSAILGVSKHTLTLSELGTPWARVSGDLAVGAWSPFRLSGRVNLRELATTALQGAELTLGGELQRIEIQATPRADWFAGGATAVVAPFAPEPLQALTAALVSVNLANLDPALPATNASVNARLAAAGGALGGPVSLENALAGAIDAGRVPVSAASGTARFDGTKLRLDDLAITLGAAGRAIGWAEAGPNGYSAELATDGVRLDRLHSALRPLAPAGTLTLTGDGGGQRLEARLREGQYALELAARLHDERLQVDSARLTMPGGAVSATARLLLTGNQPFEASARLVNFDPGRFVALPAARLNGSVEASGALQPAWRVEMSYRIADSTFAGAAATGDGRLTVTAERVAVAAARLAIGENRVRADGRFGAPGDRLDVELDAPELARLGFGLGGALRASGWVGGTPASPAFSVTAKGRRLTYRDGAAATLELDAKASQGLEGDVNASISAGELRFGGRSLARVEAKLTGSRRQHVLSAEVDDPALAIVARARGGLTDARGWDGALEKLEASRPFPAHLTGPVAVRWRPGRLETGAGALALAGGEIRFDPVVAGAETLTSRGRIEHIALASLLESSGLGKAMGTDLVVSGAWDISAAGTLNGSVQLARDAGDVMLKGSTPLPLGIETLALSALARDNVIEATLRGSGGKLGELSADLRARAERAGAAWVIAPDSPLALNSRFTIPSVSWLGPLLAPDLRTGGSAQGRVVLSGTLREPHLDGELTGEKLRVAYGGSGVRLTDGEMRIELAGDKVFFRRIVFRAGDGTLSAGGEATLVDGKPELNLDFTADKLAAVRRDDQRLVVSGRGNARSRDGALALTGEFTADSGLIELRPEGAPRLSSDVVIVSGKEGEQGAPARLRLDVTLNLGDKFFVRGEGLDVRMVGGIRVVMNEGDARPRGKGTVRVAEGRYTAFGQQLDIARGALLFDGPLDNPRLDILAVRRNQQVEAGVAITGTALSPRTALYSNPPVPDSQKLRYLVLGAGPSGISDAEFGLAGYNQNADEFVSLGTQLTSAVYVSVGQSLRNAGTFVQATLELTQRLALQGRTGAENAVTLVYTWSFD